MGADDLEIAINYDHDGDFFIICDNCGTDGGVILQDSNTPSEKDAAQVFYSHGWRHESTGIHCPDCTEDG